MRLAFALSLFVAFVLQPVEANARVSGVAPSPLRDFRVFGDSVSVGNSLMRAQPSQPLVNSVLLESSSAQVSGIPTGAAVEGAFLFWSGSTDPDVGTDRSVRFEAADGVAQTITADRCFDASAQLAPGPNGVVDYFYCRAEVTDFVAAHPRAGSYNGVYELGGMQAEAGVLDAVGECINPFCQAFYGGWSLVIVWSSETETTLRDVALYDGFRLLDETETTPAIDRYDVSGFDVADPPEATLRYFAMEGDALLGVPPQDTDPVFRCDTCFDYIEVNGSRLSDPLNPENNAFNSTIPQGIAIGIDIDSFDISNRVRPGDSTVSIEVGSGDGNPLTGHDTGAGGGELFIVGYNVLTINRLAPNFRSRNTFVSVDPTEAAPGETLFYTVVLTNDGSLDATDVVLRSLLPANTTYVPGSTRLDGALVGDVGGSSALFSGLSLGTIPATGDNDRRITFRLRVAEDTPNGTIIPFSATVDARELDVPTPTNEVEVLVVAPSLLTPEKTAIDLNGGSVVPGDFITYTVRLRKDADRSAAGLTFVDDISAFAVLTSVNAGGFTDVSDLDGGANGTGLVRIEDIELPVGVSTSTISFTVRIKTPAELLEVGVSADEINGLVVPNQGRLEAAFLPAALLTDDPATAPSPDSTNVTLASLVDFSNASTFKRAEDRNGGLLEPGDGVRFTISLRNAGNQAARINLTDALPAFLEGATLVSAPAGVSLTPAPAGANGTGVVEAFGLEVAGGATVVIRIDATVAATAPGGTVIQNVAELEVSGFPDQDRGLVSEALTVVSGPSFAGTTKRAVGGVGGFQPNEVVTWEIAIVNDGNADATGVVVSDIVDPNLTAVTPLDGGVYDAASRTIRWVVGDVPVGASQTLRFETRIGVGVAEGTRISNQATVASDAAAVFVSDDPATPAVDDPTVIRVETLPELRVEKTVAPLDGGAFEPGQAVRYTLTVANDGRASARDVVVDDVVPAALESIVVGEGGALVGGTIRWTSAATPGLASVAPGARVVLTFEATIPLDAANGAVISNQASATGEPDLVVLSDDPSTPAPFDATAFTISALADLSGVEKTVVDLNGGAFQPGDRIRYEIVIPNAGTGAARDLVVRDPIAATLGDVVVLDGGLFDGGEAFWTPAGALLPGDTLVLRIEATITGGLPNGTLIANQAAVSSPDIGPDVLSDDPSTANADDPTVFEVVSRPDFATSTKAVERVGGGAEFRPGDEVQYTIVVENTGTATARDVLVTDPIDPNLVNVVASSGGTVDAGFATWLLAELAPGEGVTLTLTGTIAFPLTDGTLVSNQATIVAADAPPTPTDDPATALEDDATEFVVTSQPDLSATLKTFRELDGDGVVRPGDRVEYTILVANNGTQPATDVVVTDILDASLEDVDPGDAIFDEATRTLTWNAGTTPALAVVDLGDANIVILRFEATVRTPLPNGTRVDNQATLVADGVTAVSDDPTTATVGDPTSFQVISSFDFSTSTKQVTVPASGVFRPNDVVTYTIVVTNTGTDAGLNAVVEDVLPDTLSFVGATPAAAVDGQRVTWSSLTTPALERLGVGDAVVLELQARLVSPLADGTVVLNQATVDADGGAAPFFTDDPTTPENDDATALSVTSAPSLAASEKRVLDLDADGFFEPGDEIEYQLVVRNTGDDDARDVSVLDRLPLDALEAVVVLDGGVFDGVQARWDAGTTPALAVVEQGAADVVLRVRARIRADVADGQVVLNQASLTPAGGLVDVTDDPTTDPVGDPTGFTVVAAARFDGFSKAVVDVNGGAPEPGDAVVYTLELRNDGTQPATNVTVIDPVPAALQDVEPLDGGTIVGDSVQWRIGTVAPGEVRVLRFGAVIRPDTPNGTRVANQAVAQADGLDALPSDDLATPDLDDPTAFVVVARGRLDDTTKTVTDLNGGFIEPGDVLRYTIVVPNNGFGPAANVVVRDTFDTAAFSSVIPGQGGRIAGNTVVWDASTTPALGAIAPGSSVSLTLDATLRADIENGSIIANQANVVDADGVAVLSDDPSTPELDDATLANVFFPSLRASTKSVILVEGAAFTPGAVVQYTIRVDVPAGPALTGVVVEDVVDPLLTDVIGATPIAFDPETRVLRVDRAIDPRLQTVTAGSSVDIVFQARIAADAPIGTIVANQAELFANERADATLTDDPTTAEPDDPTVFVVTGDTPAVLDGTTKRVTDVNGGFVEPGDILRYEIVVPNTGTGETLGLTIVDAIPARTSLVGGTVRVGGAPVEASAEQLAAGLTLPELGAGETTTVELQVRLDGDVLPGVRISNQAFVSDEQGELAPSDDPTTEAVDDATSVLVGDVADLSRAIKRVVSRDENGDGIPQVGETLVYTIDVQNEGTRAAEGVVITDPIPENTEYVAGTLRVRGFPVTDAPGDDAGEIVGRTIRVNVGQLAPGGTTQVVFEVIPVEGDLVTNQAAIRFDEGAGQTDDDGDPSNGVNPTQIALNGASAGLRATKSVADGNGGDIEPGDVLTYVIRVDAPAGSDAATVVDVPDETIATLAPTAVPVDVGVDAVDGTLRFAIPALEPGDSRVIVLRGVIAEDVEDGTEVCNALTSDAFDGDVLPACAVVGGRVGVAALSGRLFRERGLRNGVFDAETDEPVEGFVVRLVRATEGTVAAELVADEEGGFALSGLDAGSYLLEVYGGDPALGGALFSQQTQEVPSGGAIRLDVLVDPSGVVYASESLAPVEGARVFLFYDRGIGDVGERELVRDEDLASPTQQGQRVPANGFYRFDARTNAAYELVVEPGPAGLAFPSNQRPPEPEPLFADGRVDVVAQGDPADVPEDEARYFLRVELSGDEAGVFQNHIPLDPLTDQVLLAKRADRSSAVVGDIVTYTITVENRSNVDLVYDPVRDVGGLRIHDDLPRTFRYVDGSAVASVQAADGALPQRIDVDAQGERNVVFGAIADGAAVPFDVPSGGRLELRYFAVLGSSTEPGRRYTNTAIARHGTTGEALSRPDEVQIRVEYDPVFDEGVLLGKVYCDDNGDGRQQRGERGLPGARVYLDAGYYADVDSDGQFHFSEIEPGLHLIKIDTASLPFGSTLTTEEARAFNVTRGLPIGIDFGVACSDHRIQAIEVIPGDDALAEAQRLRALRYVEIDAQLGGLAPDADAGADAEATTAVSPSLRVAGRDVPLFAFEAALSVEGTSGPALDLRLDEDARLVAPVTLTMEAASPVQRWVFEVRHHASGRVVYALQGRALPDEPTQWDGTDAAGVMVLDAPDTYVAVTRAFDDAGRMSQSAPTVLRVAETRPRFLAQQRFSDVEMGERRIDPAVLEGLRAMQPELEATAPATIRVEAHLDDRDGAEDELATTREQAIAVARFMVSELGVARERIEPTGYGITRPLYPNVADRTRETNRRIEIRVVDPEPDVRAPETIVLDMPEPGVIVNQRAIVAGERDRITEQVPRPRDGLAAITLVTRDGATRSVLVQTEEGAELATIARPEWPEVEVRVDVNEGMVQIGDARTPLLGSGGELEVNAPFARVNGVRLEPALAFRSRALPSGASWRFEILEPSGLVVWSEAGTGELPEGWRWPGRTSDGGPLSPGLHEARVIVRLADGGLVASSPARFEVLAGDAEPLGIEVEPLPSVVRINGVLAPLRDGVAVAQVRTGTGRSVLVDVQHEGRQIVPVVVPDGFAPAARRTLDLSAFQLWVSPTDTNAATTAPADDAVAPASEAPATPEEPEAEDEVPATEPPRDDVPTPAPPAEPATPSPFTPRTSKSAPPWSMSRRAPSIALDLVAQAGDASNVEPTEDAPPPSWNALARFYEEELEASLSLDADAEWQAIARDAEAGVIDVHLPPEGVSLRSRHLPVFGTTVPTNRVFINGVEASVDRDGRFETRIELDGGEDEVVIETLDAAGNRGRLVWPVTVNRSSAFFMAIADTGVGTRGAEIAGLHNHNSRRTEGGALLYGQARMYFKGWVSGEDILSGQWDDIDVTAHVDTGARRSFRSFVDETIEPDRDYPVFGDASEVVADVETDGKVYVLIEADDSTARWGNFNTELRGIEVLRYERNLYGAQVALDEVIADEFRTELQIHVADEEDQVAQGFDYLRGTGGSIYYLSERQLIEGSERVSMIVRDRVSGVELSRRVLSRNADYTMRYNEGRIITKAPVPSVVDDGFQFAHTGTTRSLLSGHPVYLEVAYDHEGGTAAGDLSYGVQARETFYDWVRVGGTVVEEQRSGTDGYSLWGVEAGVGPTETTRVDVEFARSQSDDRPYAYSDDGGLTFGSFRVDDTADDEGDALFVRGRFEIADVIEAERERIWNVEAYYQDLDRGYFANGTILDQGERKIGVASQWAVTEAHTLSVRHDQVFTEVDDLDTEVLGDTALVERQLTMAQYAYELGPGTFTLAYQHSFVDDARVDDGYENDIVAAGIGARVLPWLRLGVEQELVIRGEDPRLLRGADGPGDTRIEDRFVTTVSAEVQIVEGLDLIATERFRYSGENAAQVGLRARFADQSTMYVQQRVSSRAENHGVETTTVVGGEDRHGADGSGRTYGEYHFDNGASGQRTRAVLGFGKRWEVTRGLSLDVGYERSETLTAISPDSDASRDTFSTGWEFLHERVRLSGLFEARLDQGATTGAANGGCLGDDVAGNPAYCRDRVTAVGNRRQLASLLTAQWQVTRDTSWFARFDYVVTDNRTLELLESRDIEGTLGFAYRPVAFDTVDVLARYTYLGEMAPYGLALNERREERSHVMSVAPIIELPWNFQWVEKVAYRHIRLNVEGMPEVRNDLWLLINRLNYHLLRRVDIGAEYRFLHQSLTQDWEHGVLLEAAYILQDHVRLGLGYNFTRFTEDELGDFDRDASGVFFRVTAQY